MKRLFVCSVLFALAIASVGPIAPAPALPRGARVETYQGGLNFPVDMAWVPGTKKLFFTEKSGRIRVVVRRTLKSRPCRRLDVDDSGEGGALGLALHPRFKKNHFLYVYWTKRSPHENRVTRFTVRNNRCRSAKPIITGIRAGGLYHHGGQLEFAKGKLYVSVGDSHDPAEAQNKRSRLGKILRINPNGSIPASNPFGNAVWSYGLRNPFGLTHEPGTARIYSTENGPNCNDEVNHIKKGRNYGWGPNSNCPLTQADGPNPVPPIKRWANVVVPTDPWWYRGRFRAMSGSLYVGTYGTGELWRFNLNDRGTQVSSARVAHTDGAGILDVAKGPGGWLYYLTPNAIKRIVRR